MSPLKASEAQLFYAKILNRLTLIGFGVLVVAFFIYILGILSPYVTKAQVLTFWAQSSHHYLQANNIQPGWAWVSKLGYSDFIVYIPIAMLAGNFGSAKSAMDSDPSEAEALGVNREESASLRSVS